MSKYVPSKVCPHRACRYLHITVVVGSLVQGLTSRNVLLQFAVVVVFAMYGNLWRVRRKHNWKPRPFKIERANEYLIVRKWWARAAVAGDIYAVLLMLLFIAANMTARVYGVSAGGDDLPAVIAWSLGTTIPLALAVWCHYMATRPGKPKRVRVPRGVSFQGV